MKISERQLVQIIKEEVDRYKQIKLLENRKQQIIRQLNEMKVCQECGQKYEESLEEDNMEEGSDKMVDEILGKLFGKTSPEEKREAMKTFINNHPTYKYTAADVAEKYNKDEKEVFDKLVDFFVKEGTLVDNNTKVKGIKAFVYDPQKNMFLNKTKVSAQYGPMSGKGEL